MNTRRNKPALRVAFQSVGCKLNQYEIEALKFGFGAGGCRIVPFGDDADICVINTCTVTGAGDADSRKAVRRARRVNPEATVVATGCYAHRRPDELKEAGASLVVDNFAKPRLQERLAAHLRAEGHEFDVPERSVSSGGFLQMAGSVDFGRTRGALQVQDGCDEHCTYCIIPSVRGAGRSRPLAEVIEQAKSMVASGYRELALTGVHTGSYGSDRGDYRALVTLLERLETVEGLRRVRLNSIEPGYFSEPLIEFATTSQKLCRHFHIPLQSGNEQVLRRMGRRYLLTEYRSLVEKLAHCVPGCALGADVMVGFPGETDTQFADAVAFVDDLPLSYLHVFSYSARESTPATQLSAHTDSVTKKDRNRELTRLGERKRLAFHQRHVGDHLQILVEEDHANGTELAAGLTDNYIKVLFSSDEAAVNDFVTVHIDQAREDLVYGNTVA